MPLNMFTCNTRFTHQNCSWQYDLEVCNIFRWYFTLPLAQPKVYLAYVLILMQTVWIFFLN